MSRDRLSLFVFVVTAFGFPWTGWTVLQAAKIDWSAPLGQALFSTGLACSLGGLIAVWTGEGFRGVVDRLVSAVRVRASARWWLFVLLAPLAMVVASGGLYGLIGRGAWAWPEWSAARNWWSLAALMIFIPGPLGEEFGWRGFLQPWLTRRIGFVGASLTVGLVWGVWHLPLYWGRVVDAGWVWFALFCLGVTAFGVLLGAVWERTRSLLAVMVLHFGINLTQNWSLFPQWGEADGLGPLIAFVAASWALALTVLGRQVLWANARVRA